MIWRDSDGSSGSIPCTSRCGLICGQCGSSGLDRCQSTHNWYMMSLRRHSRSLPIHRKRPKLTKSRGVGHSLGAHEDWAPKFIGGMNHIGVFMEPCATARWEPPKRSLGLQHFTTFYDFYPGYDINHSK
jgi:hypothetical protein